MNRARRSRVLYPNAGTEALDSGVSRRQLLTGSVAAGVAATAGCTGSSGGDTESGETVLVFNTGDGTVSVIDPRRDEVVETHHLGLTSSFPSNQYTPTLTDGTDDVLWLNVGRGVRGLRAGSLTEQTAFETGSGANWLEQTPDGRHLVVSAREPSHTQFRIDADPSSESFGTVTAEIDRSNEGGTGSQDGPGPCDVTIHPDGQYAYVPDIFGDTLTVIDVEAFEIVTQVAVDPVAGEQARPWMATVSPDGSRLLVEHNEGSTGTEGVWDLSDPAAPEEIHRLTGDDGLGELPLTSEIGPDSEIGYVFTPDTTDVTVVDLEGEVRGRIDLGGSAFTGTWEPNHEKLYVPVQTSDEVAVIDHASGERTATIPVGAKPYGATAARVRPTFDRTNDVVTALATMGVEFAEQETTYCLGNCACGHEL